MEINIEKKSGFCFGVVKAIGFADDILNKGEKLYCLGQIVHNENEVRRLTGKGLKFITYDELPSLRDCKLLLRAHGEPPATYEIARRNNIEIIDGTCPIVKRIQTRIKNDGSQSHTEEQIIIFGKINHPEVRGLVAQVPEKTDVIESINEAERIRLKNKVYLYAQTTMNPEDFGQVCSILKKRLEESHGELVVNNTICPHVSHRKPGLVKFARQNDVIIFVAGSNSSNGKMLFDACKAVNENCHYVTDAGMIEKSWFDNAGSAGISGATSTPNWQIREVYDRVVALTSDHVGK